MSRDREQQDRRVAYAIFRLTMGINIGLHGATRIVSGASGFAEATGKSFDATLLPGPLIWGFLAVLPFAEAAIGLALTLGRRTRLALTSDALLMSALVFGTALRGDWSSLGIQMIYVLATTS